MLATLIAYINSAIRRHYFCMDIWWNPFVGEVVCCELEERNAHDPLAVTLKTAGTGIGGHQQAEIEILHCHVVALASLISNLCLKFKT